jgi:hypothetical protein
MARSTAQPSGKAPAHTYALTFAKGQAVLLATADKGKATK